MLRGRRIHLSWAGSMMSTGSASTTWPGIPLTPSRVAWSLRWVPFTFCQLKLISSDGGKHWRVRWACDLRTWIHWPKGAHPILHQGYKHGLWAQQWHHSDRRVGQVIITYYLLLEAMMYRYRSMQVFCIECSPASSTVNWRPAWAYADKDDNSYWVMKSFQVIRERSCLVIKVIL